MPRPKGLRHWWLHTGSDAEGRDVDACRRCGVVRTALSSVLDLFVYPNRAERRVDRKTGVPPCLPDSDGPERARYEA